MSKQPKERPILFSGPMVRAILGGRKTQTRRLVKWPQKAIDAEEGCTLHERRTGGFWPYAEYDGNEIPVLFPYGKPGGRLWVRETFCELRRWHFHDTTQPRDAMLVWSNLKNGCAYAAEITPGSDSDDARKELGYKWKPSIHMPRWASRITLEITNVRVERLNEISEADAMAEGVERIELGPSEINGSAVHPMTSTYVAAFERLWEAINGPGSWAANPWVWVVDFVRLETDGGQG